MKDIIGGSDTKMLVRFCKGYEKSIWMEDLLCRYDCLCSGGGKRYEQAYESYRPSGQMPVGIKQIRKNQDS